jgi:Flp pilus assembly protein TadD
VTSHVRKPREAISALAGCAALILCLVQARQSAYAASHETSQSVVDATIEQARRLFADGRYGESAKALATVETPSAPVLFWLGRTQFELHDYPAAIQTLERGVALAPDDAEMHRWLGRAYGEEANRKSSLSLAIRVRRQFEEAVRLDPMNLGARRDLLEFYLEAPRLLGGGDDKARRQVAAITAVDPVAGHLASARLARDHGDAARVNAEYRAVFDARPADVEPYIEAAEYYEARNDAEGLRAAADGVAGVAPNDPRLSYILGVLRVIEGGAFASAETSLKAYLMVPPRSDRPGPASTHEWLGRLYEESGALVRAAAEYRTALALEPGRKFAKESLRRLGPLLPK